MEIDEDVLAEVIELLEAGLEDRNWLSIEEGLELLKQENNPTDFEED
jgi:hypothetical protein